MNVTIDRPELVRLIDDEVSSGRFASAEVFVSELLEQYVSTRGAAPDDELDDRTAAQLNRAYDRGLRGEGGRSVEDVREQILGRRRDG